MVHILENFEHYFTGVGDECNCAVVCAFVGIAFLWEHYECKYHYYEKGKYDHRNITTLILTC